MIKLLPFNIWYILLEQLSRSTVAVKSKVRKGNIAYGNFAATEPPYDDKGLRTIFSMNYVLVQELPIYLGRWLDCQKSHGQRRKITNHTCMAVIIVSSGTTIIQVKVPFQILWHKLNSHYKRTLKEKRGGRRKNIDLAIALCIFNQGLDRITSN